MVMCRAWLVVAVVAMVAVLACATVAKMPRLEDRCTPCTQVGRLQYKALQTVQQQAARKGRAEPADGDGDGEGSGQDDGESGGGEEDAIIGKDTAGEEEESEEEEIGSGGEKVEGRRDREGGNLEERVDSEDVVGEAEGGEVEAESEGGGEVCGTDGASYSSLCTLQLAGCTRNWNIRTAPACPGRCPGLNLGRSDTRSVWTAGLQSDCAGFLATVRTGRVTAGTACRTTGAAWPHCRTCSCCRSPPRLQAAAGTGQPASHAGQTRS